MDVSGTAGLGNDRREVLYLPLDGVGGAIPACAAPAAVIGVDGESRGQELRQGSSRGGRIGVIEGAADEDQRGAAAEALE